MSGSRAILLLFTIASKDFTRVFFHRYLLKAHGYRFCPLKRLYYDIAGFLSSQCEILKKLKLLCIRFAAIVNTNSQ